MTQFLLNIAIAVSAVILYAAFGHEIRAVVTRTGARHGVYRAGYSTGYEAGYQAGRRIARPVVIPTQTQGDTSGFVPTAPLGEVASERPTP